MAEFKIGEVNNYFSQDDANSIFKANIDDLRESPSYEIAKTLTSDENLKVLIVEPNIDCLPDDIKRAELCTIDYALENSNLNIMLVDHDEFKKVDLSNYNFFDTKGLVK